MSEAELDEISNGIGGKNANRRSDPRRVTAPPPRPQDSRRPSGGTVVRSSVYLFGELDDADVDWFVSVGVRQIVSPGATLLTEGVVASHLFIVLDGTLRVTAGPAEQELNRLARGDIAGEVSFIDGRPPSATVRALDQAVVLGLPRGVLRDRLFRDGRFAARFYKTLAMLLAERLRLASREGTGADLQLDPETFDADEVAPDTLDTLFLAGQRFERLLRQTAITS